MSVPPTVESASSSSRTGTRDLNSSTLLPTPNTGDMKSAQTLAKRKAGGHQPRLADLLVGTLPQSFG